MDENIQEPTVGRIVHYWDTVDQKIPMPAMVQAVVPGSLRITTLIVFRHDGVEAVEAVPHMSEATNANPNGAWDWMAYQKGQAAKTETLQEQLRQQANMDVIQKPLSSVHLTEMERLRMAQAVGKDAYTGLNTLARTPKPE